MPLLIVLVVLLGLVLTVVLLTPLSLLLRYRVGRTRRLARGWVASLNAAGFGMSVLVFLISAGFTSFWAPRALSYAAGGLLGGLLLGALGLAWTRWETTPRDLYFTPNAWLALSVTLVVSGRIAYSLWRLWHAWDAGFDYSSIIVTEGVRGSLAAAGIVLGYYLAFWIGVRRRVRRHHLRRAAPGAVVSTG